MLKIRLSRTGKKSQASYRIVVQEHTAPIKGKFVELVGHYIPTQNPKVLEINSERVKYWLSVGATPSDTVASLLKREGIDGMDKYLAPRDKKRKKKNAPEEEEAPAAPAAPAAEAPKEEAAPAAEPAAEEAPSEEKAEEPAAEEAPAPEVKEEVPAEEAAA